MKRTLLLAFAAVASMLFVVASVGRESAAPATRRQPSPAQRHRAPRESLVGAFTTYFPCCQPRVTNIRRAAALLDGSKLGPWQTFSLNQALGRRTPERGFVAAPMILDGQFVNSVGGGISQLATTLYNAAFFAGLKLVAHTPHSIYIKRYPAGREATVSWGGPELVFVNDWPAAVHMRVRTTRTSVSVQLYSRRLGRRITTHTGPRYDYIAPRTRYLTGSGHESCISPVVQQTGGPGFSIDYQRDVYVGDVQRSHERFHTTYRPLEEVLEVCSALR